MKVISHNSVNLLFEKAEQLAEQPHESWRAVYFRFSDRPEKRNLTLYNNFVVRAIVDLLADMPGYIYLCEDADIFIVFQGALKPVLAKLATHFGDVHPGQEISGWSDGDVVGMFDLGRHWHEFYNMCAVKYHAGLVFEEESHRRVHPTNYVHGMYASSSTKLA